MPMRGRRTRGRSEVTGRGAASDIHQMAIHTSTPIMRETWRLASIGGKMKAIRRHARGPIQVQKGPMAAHAGAPPRLQENSILGPVSRFPTSCSEPIRPILPVSGTSSDTPSMPRSSSSAWWISPRDSPPSMAMPPPPLRSMAPAGARWSSWAAGMLPSSSPPATGLPSPSSSAAEAAKGGVEGRVLAASAPGEGGSSGSSAVTERAP
mmetsp:Transcript_48638/g.155642  ORF Transcript_48638/g.155642 Transcript_48638/m.155642 type:complete len:208 (-) Transcript_48638:1126-1749(-)